MAKKKTRKEILIARGVSEVAAKELARDKNWNAMKQLGSTLRDRPVSWADFMRAIRSGAAVVDLAQREKDQ